MELGWGASKRCSTRARMGHGSHPAHRPQRREREVVAQPVTRKFSSSFCTRSSTRIGPFGAGGGFRQAENRGGNFFLQFERIRFRDQSGDKIHGFPP